MSEMSLIMFTHIIYIYIYYTNNNYHNIIESVRLSVSFDNKYYELIIRTTDMIINLLFMDVIW